MNSTQIYQLLIFILVCISIVALDVYAFKERKQPKQEPSIALIEDYRILENGDTVYAYIYKKECIYKVYKKK